VAAASVWSFATFARAYAGITYPADFLFETLSARRCELRCSPNCLWSGLGGRFDRSGGLPSPIAMVADAYPGGFYGFHAPHESARRSGARFICVNLKWIRTVPEVQAPFEPPLGYLLIAEAESPLGFPALAFEERTHDERRRLAHHRHVMRIYERADCVASNESVVLVHPTP
jgi:hypothetical protein